jgi:hypothetical protein
MVRSRGLRVVYSASIMWFPHTAPTTTSLISPCHGLFIWLVARQRSKRLMQICHDVIIIDSINSTTLISGSGV